MLERTCDLCQAARLTRWYSEDDVCWVADCELCDVPMVVWRRHGIDPSADEIAHMTGALERAAAEHFASWVVDGHRRNIPDHWHAHARPSGTAALRWWARRFRSCAASAGRFRDELRARSARPSASEPGDVLDAALPRRVKGERSPFRIDPRPGPRQNPAMEESGIRVERRDHVDVVTIDRPSARNALTHASYAALERAVRETTARCMVITGAGTTFCSGDDVKQVMGGGDGSAAARLAASPAITPAAAALLATDVPLIAAVNGAAVGWGMELALMCDLRVATDSARFGELFVLRGLCCDVAGLARLASLVGREKATELLLTGDVIDATEAERIGLVSRVVPAAHLMDAALYLAQKIAANPPLAVARLKAGLRLALDPDWERLGAWVSSTLAELFVTDDHKEGVRAFLEKRPARFVGR